jgi:hypothetical protein
MQQPLHAGFIHLLDFTMTPGDMGSCVVDFSVMLLKVLGYILRDRVPRTRMGIDLFICGRKRRTKADVCLFDARQNDIVLLIQEDTTARSSKDPQVQLVVKAIAAFNENNATREAAGLHPLAEQVSHFRNLLDAFLKPRSFQLMPGIVMDGTSPSFFKIPVTQTLSTYIAHGTYPQEATEVTFCHPPLPDHSDGSNGMKPLDNRYEILRCYEAFKAYI